MENDILKQAVLILVRKAINVTCLWSSNPKNSNFVFSSLRNREKLMMLVLSEPAPVRIPLGVFLLLDKTALDLAILSTPAAAFFFRSWNDSCSFPAIRFPLCHPLGAVRRFKSRISDKRL